MERTELPAKPAIDICGPLGTGKSVFVVVHYYSRWTNVTIMKKHVTLLA